MSTLLCITTLKYFILGSCIAYLQRWLVGVTQILFITQLINQVNNYIYLLYYSYLVIHKYNNFSTHK